MRRYWWVNHKQTHKQEIEGCFLWSPKNTARGSSEFYNNMRIASPGDFVLSYADGRISYWGQVTDNAFSSPKPSDFGKAGDAWSEDGWLLPVIWTKIQSAVRPREFIEELGPLLPKKYSPIGAASGKGHQGAYLANVGIRVFQTVMSKAGLDLDLAFGTEELASLFGVFAEELGDAIERQLELSTDFSITERSQVILARRGQGKFRTNVHALEPGCRVTGVKNPQLLVASHIKPWSSCSNSAERLDGSNGLLLTPHVDHLFDHGLISFQDCGSLIVSPRVPRLDMELLGLDQTFARMPTRNFTATQCSYLNYHRKNVYIEMA